MEPREFFVTEARRKATALGVLAALVAALLWYLYAIGGDAVFARLALAGAVLATVLTGSFVAVGWLSALAVVVIRHTPVNKS